MWKVKNISQIFKCDAMYAHKEDKETNIFIGKCSEKFELKTENSAKT